MANSILSSIADLARLRRVELRPDWADAAQAIGREDEEALDSYCEAIGWGPSSPYAENPRAHEFPLLIYHQDHGWAVAEQLEGDDRVRVVRSGIPTVWNNVGDARLYDLVIPLPAGKKEFTRAFDVFKEAVFRRKHVFVLATIATVVVNMIALGTSLFTMQVYDRVVPRGAFSTLWVLLAGVIFALLFDFALRVVRAGLLEREAVAIDTEVSEYFFSRANDVRLDARPPSIGTMAAQLKSLETVRQVMSSGTMFALADLPFAVLFIIIIAMLGGVIAVVLAIAFPLAIGLALIFARLIKENTRKSQISGNKKNGLLVEALDSSETVKANRGQWYLLSRWNSLLDELHETELPVRNLQAMANTIFGTMQQISYVCLISWGAVEVYENHITMGGLIACSIIAGRVNGPLIAQLPGMLVQWTYAKASLDMLDQILDLPTDRPIQIEQLRPNRVAAAVSMKDVEFAYAGGRSAIQIPKLEIRAGERIGILGPVGSGKSTLLKLMSGLYAPNKGQILIDRLDMSQVADDILRENIGYLPQDYRLVNGSLRENLLLGIPDPGDDVIMDIARKTGLAGMVTAHPRGLDLPIAEGGRGLSGGQRVLTGLTRLLLARPKLLLLDEPTSNLDVDTEAQILRTLHERAGPDTTMIIVTHKMQIVNLVQRLILVSNGQIMLDGPTAEVMKRFQKPQAQTQQQPGAAGAQPAIGGNA